MSHSQSGDLFYRWHRPHAVLRAENTSIRLLLGDATDTARVAGRRDRNRRFALTQERVLGRIAPVFARTAFQLRQQPARWELRLASVDRAVQRGRGVSARRPR